MGFPGGSDSKEPACNAGNPGSIPGSVTIPWRREWLPTPVFLTTEFHGQKSLGLQFMDTTEWLTFSLHWAKYAADSLTICQTVYAFQGIYSRGPLWGSCESNESQREKRVKSDDCPMIISIQARLQTVLPTWKFRFVNQWLPTLCSYQLGSLNAQWL